MKKQIGIKFDTELLERIDGAAGGNRTAFIEGAVRTVLEIADRRRAEQTTSGEGKGSVVVTSPPAPLDAEEAREAQENEALAAAEKRLIREAQEAQAKRVEQEEINRARRARTLKQRKL